MKIGHDQKHKDTRVTLSLEKKLEEHQKHTLVHVKFFFDPTVHDNYSPTAFWHPAGSVVITCGRNYERESRTLIAPKRNHPTHGAQRAELSLRTISHNERAIDKERRRLQGHS